MTVASRDSASQEASSPPAGASLKTWIAVCGAALGAFLAILNIQIVGSSLADIQGAIGAGADEGGWITTSYLVAEIIVIPMSGWLTRILSMRTYLIGSAVAFIVFTVACAFTHTLGQMIVMRAIQGFAGGALIPLAFSIIMTSLPRHQLAIGMAVYSLAAVLAPSIGPVAGGYFNDRFGWQSIFYISVLPGLLTVAILWTTIAATEREWHLLAKGDWWGILTMAVGLGCLQTVLEEGNRKDWLGSSYIFNLSVIATVSLIIFTVIQFWRKEPLLHLRILGQRNFGLGTVLNFVFGFTMYGWIFTLPMYLARLHGYNSRQIGAVMIWLGLPQLLLIAFLPRLMRLIDPRMLAALGFLLYGVGTVFATPLSPDFSGEQFMFSNIIRALAQVLVMTPLAALATGNVERRFVGSAAAIFNMMRNLGGAIGIALLQTFITHREQYHSEVMTTQVTLFSPATSARLHTLTEHFMSIASADPLRAQHQAYMTLGEQIRTQASLLAYADTIWLQGTCLFAAFVVVLFFKRQHD
ncbi:multidrug efflux MFS transporter [Pseudomonas gingeri]|uniref:MDR family MFS transporter n=1 Tax=Pseudomonas gingeri TaxID=117681 RepID=UPI0015A41DE5|nr:MDR family MFS transporter [Pseudomonas gingeri]NVZ24687.1 multidrug efflux MFS transporter [Pseudomonas gingeri]